MERASLGYAPMRDGSESTELVRAVLRDLEDVYDCCEDALCAVEDLAGAAECLLNRLDGKRITAA